MTAASPPQTAALRAAGACPPAFRLQTPSGGPGAVTWDFRASAPPPRLLHEQLLRVALLISEASLGPGPSCCLHVAGPAVTWTTGQRLTRSTPPASLGISLPLAVGSPWAWSSALLRLHPPGVVSSSPGASRMPTCHTPTVTLQRAHGPPAWVQHPRPERSRSGNSDVAHRTSVPPGASALQ